MVGSWQVKHVALVVSSWSRCACLPRKQVQGLPNGAGWPRGVAMWPPPSPGHLWSFPCVGVSCLEWTHTHARPAGLSDQPWVLCRCCTPTLVINPGCWIADLDSGLHWVVGPLIHVQAFQSIWSNWHPIHDSEALYPCYFASGLKTWQSVWGCQASWPRRGRSVWVCTQLHPILAHVLLKSKLIQNL